jgi:hypothetical protein
MLEERLFLIRLELQPVPHNSGRRSVGSSCDLPQGPARYGLILRTLALGPQRGWAISERIHHCAAAPAGITGTQSAEGCSASCRIVLVAETNSRLVA